MKSRLLIALAAICFFSQTGNAQTIVYDKYFVGVDLHWIWGKYNTNPSLSFKIIDSKRSKSGTFSARKGWRFRLHANYDKLAGLGQVISGVTFPTQYASVGFYPGYEWHKSYKMFDFFYGFDFLIGTDSGRELYYWFWDNNQGSPWHQWTYWTRQNRVGGGPIAGLSIRIIEGLHISLESAWYASYYTNKYTTVYNQGPPEVEKARGFRTAFSPVNTLQVTFSFR